MKRGFFQIFFVLSLFFTFSLSVVVVPETVGAQASVRTEESRVTVSSTPQRDTYMIKYTDGYTLIVNDEKANFSFNNAQLYPPGTTFTGQGENWASKQPVETYSGGAATRFEYEARFWSDPNAETLSGNPGDQNRYKMSDSMGDVSYWTQRIMDFLLNTWLKVITGVLGVAGYVFDKIVAFALDNSVFQPGGKLHDVVDTLWAFIRDLANIVIVFSMLYLAIRTILDGEGFADKSKLANVLLAAILINFSLFATKAAFTISNEVALGIRGQININEGGSIEDGAVPVGPSANDSLSEGIMRTLGVPKSIQNISDSTLNNSGNLNDYQAIQFQYLLMLTFSVIGIVFVLGAGALMLLYRFLMFVFLIILSPIGLVCFFIPWLKKYGQEWVDKVKALTLMGPVYFLSFYVSMLLLSNIVALGNVTTEGFLGIMVQMVMQTLLIVGTLFGTIMLPLKLTSAGGEFIGNMGKWTEGKFRSMGNSARAMPGRAVRGSAQLAGRGAASTLAHGGRLVGGKWASRLVGGSEDDQKKLKAMARDGNAMQRAYAKSRLGAAEGLKNRTYDFRNIGGVGKKMGIGDGIKSYNAAVDERKEKMDKRQKDEMKKYGYDDLAKSKDKDRDGRTAADRLIISTSERDNAKDEHDKAKEVYAAALKSTSATTDQKERMLEKVKQMEKELGDAERKVGREKNIGMATHFEKMEMEWAHKMTPVRRAALAKMRKEFEKKIKEDGKSKQAKKKNQAASPTVTVSSSSSGGGTTTAGGGTP